MSPPSPEATAQAVAHLRDALKSEHLTDFARSRIIAALACLTEEKWR